MDWVLLGVMLAGMVAAVLLRPRRHGPRYSVPLGAEDEPIRFHVDAGYGAICPRDRCGFVTRGWPTPTLAQSRLDQHLLEHRTGQQMPDLPPDVPSPVART